MTFKNPKGSAVVSSIIAIVVTIVVVVLTGPIGLGILAGANGLFCSVNVFWGCSNGSNGGTTYTASVNDPCSSAPNACGMTNNGTIVNVGGGNGQCNADIPPNSACPPPVIAQGGGFYAAPSTVGPGGQTTLHWNASNATDCTVSGDNGFSYSGATSGSISTGVLAQTTLFTLTCENGVGGSSTSASFRVIADPQYKEI